MEYSFEGEWLDKDTIIAIQSHLQEFKDNKKKSVRSKRAAFSEVSFWKISNYE